MIGLWKHVNDLDALDPIRFMQYTQVADECRDIAGGIDDPRGVQAQEAIEDTTLASGARLPRRYWGSIRRIHQREVKQCGNCI